MKITPKEQKKFQKATKCWICQEALVKDKSHKDYKKKHNQLEITAILQVNTGVQRIAFVTFNMENQGSPL